MLKFDGSTTVFDGNTNVPYPVHLEAQDRRDSLIGWYRAGSVETDSTARSFAFALVLKHEPKKTVYRMQFDSLISGGAVYLARWTWPTRLTLSQAKRTGGLGNVMTTGPALFDNIGSYVDSSFSSIFLDAEQIDGLQSTRFTNVAR